MMTVRDFATGAIRPEEMTVLVGGEEYELLTEEGKINNRLLELLGDFVIEDYKASTPNHYAVWVLMRPVKIDEVEKRGTGA